VARVLIFGTSYIKNETDLWIVRQWVRLNRTLNPEADLLIVDSDSPVPPPADVPLLQFGNNIGHQMRGGGDGWGRAFCAGLGQAWRYDWIVHMETDLLFVRPVRLTLDRMRARGVRVTAPWAWPYMFPETGLMLMDAAWVRETRLAERYDRSSTLVPELQIEQLLGDEWFVAPLRGARDDDAEMDLYTSFYGYPDWLTHASIEKFQAFLAVNGLQETA
jgi:hypothetical protein